MEALVGRGAKSGSAGSADFAGRAGPIEMGEEQPEQPARLHFACKVDFVDLASNAVSPLLRAGFKFPSIRAASGLCSFLNRGARQCGRILGWRRPRRIEHSRTE